MNLSTLKVEMIAEALRRDPRAKPVGGRRSFADSFTVYEGQLYLWWNDSTINSTHIVTRPIPEGRCEQNSSLQLHR